MAKEDTQSEVLAALSGVFVCRLNHTETNGVRWLAGHGSPQAEEVTVAMAAAVIDREVPKVRIRLEPRYDGEVPCLSSDLLRVLDDHRFLLGHPEAILRIPRRNLEFTSRPPDSQPNYRALLLEALAFVLATFDVDPSALRSCLVRINGKPSQRITERNRSLAASFTKFRREHLPGVYTAVLREPSP